MSNLITLAPNVVEKVDLVAIGEANNETELSKLLGLAFFSGYPGWPGIIDHENGRFIFFDETNTFQPLSDKHLTLGKFNIHRATKLVNSEEIRFDERGLPVEPEFREQLRKAYKWAILEYRRIQKLTACKICTERIEKECILCEKCFWNFHIDCLEEEHKSGGELNTEIVPSNTTRSILGTNDLPVPPPPPPPLRHSPMKPSQPNDIQDTNPGEEGKKDKEIEKEQNIIIPPTENNKSEDGSEIVVLLPPPPHLHLVGDGNNPTIPQKIAPSIPHRNQKYVDGEWVCDSCKLLEFEKAERRKGLMMMKRKKKKLSSVSGSTEPNSDEKDEDEDDDEENGDENSENVGKSDRGKRRRMRRKVAVDKSYEDDVRDEDEFITKKGSKGRGRRKKKNNDDDDFYEEEEEEIFEVDEKLKLNLKLKLPSPKRGKKRKKSASKTTGRGKKGGGKKRGRRGKGSGRGRGRKGGRKKQRSRSSSKYESSDESEFSDSQTSGSSDDEDYDEEYSSSEERGGGRRRTSRRRKRRSSSSRRKRGSKRTRKRPRRETRATLKELEGLTGRQIKRRKIMMEMDKEEIVDRYMLKREETMNLIRNNEIYYSNNRVLKLWFEECKNGLGELFQDLTSLEPYDLESISIQQFGFAVKQHQDIIEGAKEWSGGVINQIQTIIKTLQNADETVSFVDNETQFIQQQIPDIQVPPPSAIPRPGENNNINNTAIRENIRLPQQPLKINNSDNNSNNIKKNQNIGINIGINIGMTNILPPPPPTSDTNTNSKSPTFDPIE